MSTNGYTFEMAVDHKVEMVERISSPEAGDTSEECDIIEIAQETNPSSASTKMSQKNYCNIKCNKNNQHETPSHLDEEDCTIIDSDDHIDLSVKCKSKTRKVKFPKSLKAKLLEHTKHSGDSVTGTKLNKSVSNVRQPNHIRNENEETILIEEDSEKEKDNDCDIIECIAQEPAQNLTENRHSHCDKVDNFEVILSKDKLLADLIEICLDMESSSAMLRIINRTVIPMYKDTSEDFKLSDPFQRQMTKTMGKLQTEPSKKFTHLKEFCEFMKSGIHKKRVQLTTLKTNLNGKFSKTKTKLQTDSSSADHVVPNKKKKIEVINLDDDDDDEILANREVVESHVMYHNIDTSVNDNTAVGIHSIGTTVNKNILSENDACDPKNDDNTPTNDTDNSKQNDMQILIQDVRSEAAEVSNSSDNNNHCQITNVNKEKEIKANEVSPNHSNETRDGMDVICIDDENDNFKENMSENVSRHVSKTIIESLEVKIKHVNDLIKKYEEKDVDWDKDNNETSPYVVCEYYKEMVIKLYKKLCQLTGNEAVKRRRVRLKVAEGRHEGPVRFLENFINSMIDDNGNPPFPDIHDVTKCVTAANLYYKIGWSKREIEKEARALFIHFGRTVQKKRQKREWRHLMRYVKEEIVDPADADPALQARLEENARLALKNEADLFARFAELDGQRTTMGYDYATLLAGVPGPSNDKVPIPRPATTPNNSRLEINSNKDSCNGKITDNIEMHNASSNRSMVMLPNVVAIPLNVAVNQSLVPVTYYTNTIGDPVLDNTIPRNTDIEDTTINRANVEAESNANTERKMVEIEIDMKPNLNQLNGSHRNPLEGTVVPIEFESNNGGNTYEQVIENIHTGKRNDLTNCNHAQTNHVNSKQGISNPNGNTVGTSQIATKGNQVAPNLTKSSAENNDVCSVSQVYTHRTHETENMSEIANTNEEIHDNIVVKQEPLDIAKMLADLGEDFTVSIMDIEDPFEVIEISDSSDESEDE